MIPKECKRIAEVDFPIAVVSKHSAREKSIRHGHPSTLHLWWARRPLAACRAMLMALLLPDPCDPHCPEEFKKKTRQILLAMHGRPMGWEKKLKTSEGLREIILQFIGDFANWDNSANPNYLDVACALVKAAHPEENPLVVDQFAGGGSIPLEALRLGCEAFASDLNPVACLILKVMLEDIPRHGPELAEELRRVGGDIKKKAEKELATLYPKDPDGATPIAYLWARTVKCESPNCGAEIPLMRSFWLCKKVRRKRALMFKIIRPNGRSPQVDFEIFEPRTDDEVVGGTVTRAKATCVCCRAVLPPGRVRAQLSEQHGGADVVFDAWGNRVGGARMLAVVTLNPGQQGRSYRLPTDRDYQSIWTAEKRLNMILDEWENSGKKGLSPVPDEPLGRVPVTFGVINVWIYGMDNWGKLYSCRQKVALEAFTRIQRKIHLTCSSRIVNALSLAVSRCSGFWSSLNMWVPQGEFVANVFGRQAIPIVWDFCETVPTTSESGGFDGALDWVSRVIEMMAVGMIPGQAEQMSADVQALPNGSVSVWFTDPPYYDAVPYSYISDFFYVWLRRVLWDKHTSLFETDLTPKGDEMVAYLHGEDTAEHAYMRFEKKLAAAFSCSRKALADHGLGCVVFAHKTTQGWEALLSGLVSAGLRITSSWPIATERPGRLRSIDSATLATSVHLVCRPRPYNAPVGDWGEVIRELPIRVGDWMDRLQGEGVRGADLVFACIGPALEIYSRYSKVVDPDEQEIPLGGDPEAKEPHKRGFLAYVWETVGRIALGQVLGTAEARARNGMANALEEDARLTALFLWTLQATNGQNGSDLPAEASEQTGDEPDEELEEDSSAAEDGATAPKGKIKGYSLVFDVVRRFAQPLGIELPKWEGRIIETKKGVVRLMAVSERTKQLFSDDGADAVAELIERDPVKNLQQVLFPELEEEQAPKIRGRGRARRKVTLDPSAVEGDSMREATTLDRVHAAMLLQAGGQSNALRALIRAEQERGPDFLRLANALSALYPKKSEEKRLLDAMLLAVQR